MSFSEFVEECEKRTIFPGVALENDNVREALEQRDDERVRKVLDTEF
jgi:hypothetical protein